MILTSLFSVKRFQSFEWKFFAFCKLIIATNEWRQIIQNSTSKDIQKDTTTMNFERVESLFWGHWRSRTKSKHFIVGFLTDLELSFQLFRVEKKSYFAHSYARKKSSNDFCILISPLRIVSKPLCLKITEKVYSNFQSLVLPSYLTLDI